MREADGLASQSLDARSERQVVTLDTLGEYLPGQMHLARHLSGVTPPVIAGDKTPASYVEVVKTTYRYSIDTGNARYMKVLAEDLYRYILRLNCDFVSGCKFIKASL